MSHLFAGILTPAEYSYPTHTLSMPEWPLVTPLGHSGHGRPWQYPIGAQDMDRPGALQHRCRPWAGMPWGHKWGGRVAGLGPQQPWSREKARKAPWAGLGPQKTWSASEAPGPLRWLKFSRPQFP